jgi:hypothetical protein
MSWLKSGWADAKQHEELMGGYGWFDPKSQPIKTLVDQKEVTLSSFFTKLGDFFLGLR